jgi:hypothetical protein
MTETEYDNRLAEIAATAFGTQTDDQILELLAERKQLEELKLEYAKVQAEAEEAKKQATVRAEAEGELARLNALITPDKPDDELIHLIEERKTWEAKLALLSGESVREPVTVQSPVPTEATPEAPLAEPVSESVTPAEPEPVLPATVDEDFGEHRIALTTIDPASDLGRALGEMRSDGERMGKILDSLPAPAKRDKAFMLAVAAIDPAYAMHYADPEVLKKDSDFNERVVMTKGERVSGSVLAEMLPEARTGAIVLAAVKQDYRNVRFVLPQMAEYDEILSKAKSIALGKVKELKDGVDIAALIPKVLQKDKAFMEEIGKIVPGAE